METIRRCLGRQSVGLAARWLLICLVILVNQGCAPALSVEDPATVSSQINQSVSDLNQWPFGEGEEIYPIVGQIPRGVSALRRWSKEAFPVPKDWAIHLENFSTLPIVQQLETVNFLGNRLPYSSEKSETWRHPKVFFVEGGDCDCYAVTKYLLLRHLGFTDEHVRLTVVRKVGGRSYHMVVVVRGGQDRFRTYLLDNASDQVRTVLYSAEYTPFISLNERGVWLHRYMTKNGVNRLINPKIREPSSEG